jgi:molybdate transport system substrate-binding protein
VDAVAGQPAVLSTLALKGVLNQLVPDLTVRFDATQAILKLIAEGEHADLLILTGEAMDELERQGRIGRSAELGSSGVGLAVRAGAPRPEIDTVEALTRSLLAAESVAHSRVGASGIYFAGLLKHLGIAHRLKKIVIVEKGPVGVVVASGGAQIGVQQLCELAPVAGIDIVGPLPGEAQKVTRFCAGVAKAAKNPASAAALIDFLRSDTACAVMEKNRITPAKSS